MADLTLYEQANALAYNAACAAIECNSQRVLPAAHSDEPEVEWFDISDEEDLDAEVRYLDSRGLLHHHPHNPKWIQLIDESEATKPVALTSLVQHLLQRIASDARLAYYFDPMTRSMELLTSAAAEERGVDVEKVRNMYYPTLKFERPSCPECRAKGEGVIA